MGTLRHRAERSLLATALALLFLGSATAFALNLAMNRLVENQDQVEHTHEVLYQLRRTLTSIQDAEARFRGFALTGDTEFLGLPEVTMDLDDTLSALTALVRDNPEQTQRARELAMLSQERLALIEEGVAIREAEGVAAVAEFVATGRGQDVTDNIRALVIDMETTERELLAARSASSDEALGYARAAVVGLGGLSVILLIGMLVVASRTITFQRRAAAANARLAAIVSSTPDAVISLNPDLTVATWNTPAERLFGWAADEVIGHSIVEAIVPPERRGEGPAHIEAAMRGTSPNEYETVRRAKDGTLIDVSISIGVMRGVDGRTLGFATVIRDIRDRIRTEALARAELARIQALVDHSPAIIYVVEESGKITLANSRFEEAFGIPPGSAIGKSLSTILPTQLAQEYTAHDRQVREVGLPLQWEEVGPVEHGSERTYFVTRFLLPSLDGESQVCAIMTDFTSRQQMQRALQSARDEAERANRAKSEFLSRMSHELRTPLNVVLGFAQLLELDDLSEDQSESVAQIIVAGRHLLRLIDEILDISRIESGSAGLSLEPVHVESAINEALAMIRPLAAQRGITLGQAPGHCAEFVLADAQRLQQVLLNLLSNGVKYNREGGHLSVECLPAPAGRIRLAVRDTGEGIAPELLPRLFVPFDRLGAERSATTGTGLGLSLTRALVEAMAGTIDVESSPAGTAFIVELAIADSPDLTVEPRAALTGERTQAGRSDAAVVLYIEDNLSNLTLVERILQTRPYVRLIPAMQGRIGLELAQQHSPALVLLDLHLPDLSGEEVLRQLRHDPRTARIPVVVASADATQRQVERLLASGADRYLTKPLDVTLLLSVIDEFLAQPAPKPSK